MWTFLVFSIFAVANAGIVPLSTVHTSGVSGLHGFHGLHGLQGLHGIRGAHGLHGLHGLNGIKVYGIGDASNLLYRTGGISGIGGIGGIGGVGGIGGISSTGSSLFLNGGGLSSDSIFINGGGDGISSLQGGPVVSKEFYIHSAPDDVDEPVHKVINLGPGQKKYRVVFIKAPAHNSASTRISVIQPQDEEKTVIYVLAKKPDAGNIEADVHTTPTEASKPEVFFVKYKTHEEAIAAQHQIQAQYDALGGTSRISDEGVAPVTSVIGSLGGVDQVVHKTLVGTVDLGGDHSHHSHHKTIVLENDLNPSVSILGGGDPHGHGTLFTETISSGEKYLPIK